MTNKTTIDIDLDHESVVAAAEAFERLAAAAERASQAMKELAGAGHGGIKIEAVGSVMVCTILPDDHVDQALAGIEDSISKGARPAESRFKL